SPSTRSRAVHTSPCPPRPSRRRSSYLPAISSAGRGCQAGIEESGGSGTCGSAALDTVDGVNTVDTSTVVAPRATGTSASCGARPAVGEKAARVSRFTMQAGGYYVAIPPGNKLQRIAGSWPTFFASWKFRQPVIASTAPGAHD